MKNILVVLLLVILTSCERIGYALFSDDQPRRVTFGVYAQENNSYREIRMYSTEIASGDTVTLDSVIFNARNWDGTDETFPKDRGNGLSFLVDSLIKIQNGYFEAVAVRKDFSLVRKQFGHFMSGKPHEDFKVTLTANGIVVEEL